MRVRVIAERDVAFGKADDLAVLAHRRAVGDRFDCHLVAGRDIAAHRETGRIAK